MEATKVTVRIEVKVLDINSVPKLVYEAAERLQGEFENGELNAGDGDSVGWTTHRETVEF